ncbi:hypothetical protein ACQJBY_009364 [Aegilops geniculata]
MPVRPKVPVGISAVQKQTRKQQKKSHAIRYASEKKCKTKKEHESHASRPHSTSWLLVLKAQVVAATTSGLLLHTIMGCCMCALYI